MAPSTTSHHTNQSSPLVQETNLPKRSLRNRGSSNAANSSQTDIIDMEKDGGGGDDGHRSHGGNDARDGVGGNFPLPLQRKNQSCRSG